MNNIRIYISGPMAGVENYKENFAKAAEILVARGYDVVNPALLDDVITGLSREAALKLDLDLMEECDTVVLLPGLGTELRCKPGIWLCHGERNEHHRLGILVED